MRSFQGYQQQQQTKSLRLKLGVILVFDGRYVNFQLSCVGRKGRVCVLKMASLSASYSLNVGCSMLDVRCWMFVACGFPTCRLPLGEIPKQPLRLRHIEMGKKTSMGK
jgi:hypothetical protein